MINRVPWHSCNIFNDVDDNLWMVEKLYKDVVREAIPKRKAKIRSKSLPWMNSKLRKLMNQRYVLLRKANRTQESKDQDEYKRMRNRVSKELKSSEANYWKQKLAETDKGSSDFWKAVKAITGTEKSKEKRIGPIKNDTGELLSSDQQIAEGMNTFFANIGEQLASKFEETGKDEAQYICKVTPTIAELYLTAEKFTEKP